MAVTIETGTPELATELATALAATGCVVRVTAEGSCRVVHPAALDPVEEWDEIRFFLGAWLGRSGATAAIATERPSRGTAACTHAARVRSLRPGRPRPQDCRRARL